MCELLWLPDVRRYLCDYAELPRASVREMIADSLDASSMTAYWRIANDASDMIGLIGLRPPSLVANRLRTIGWRSLEIVVALDPRFWRSGFAAEAVKAVAEHAGADGVTFALVAGVDEPNVRAHALMRRCGFVELGRAAGPAHQLLVYERPL